MSRKVQQVERCAKCRRDKIAHKCGVTVTYTGYIFGVCTQCDSVASTYPKVHFLLHVPLCEQHMICGSNISLRQVPAS